ncbi:MAG: hypothetical protein OES38_21435, partial [Gammaproteobacteria bacterium]|nr:hypothetical protein [Gammaproteobacteria bacterium]
KRTVEEFDAVVSENIRDIERIYFRKLRVSPEFGGRASFRLSIEDDGQVTHCEAVDTIDDDIEFSKRLCAVLLKFDFGLKADSAPGPYVYSIALNP